MFSLNLFDVVCRRRTKQGENHAELVTISLGVVLGVVLVRCMRRKREARLAREEGSSILVLLPLEHAQELCIDATNRPHVDGLCIVFLQKNELGCAVPPAHDMAREVPPLGQLLITRIERLAGRHAKAKVADLYATILVDKAVSRLQVPVPNACRVQVVQAQEQVVEQTRNMQFVQVHLRADQFLEVGVTDLENDVDLVKALQVVRHDDIVATDEVIVVQLREDGNLPKHSLGIHKVVEQALGSLDGHFAFFLIVLCLGDTAVRSAAEQLSNLVPRRHFPGLPELRILVFLFLGLLNLLHIVLVDGHTFLVLRHDDDKEKPPCESAFWRRSELQY
mmetsp:Transcript_70083/g.182487  ORF Transcript_70083/g.182487 Transcript_70083/m.182487 type:complete len:335 (+) Transcript_70083:705-1709(+)